MFRSLLLPAVAAVSVWIGSAPSASADGWQTNAWEQHVKITGRSPDEYSYEMFTLHTTDTTKPGIMFSCSQKFGLNILFSYKSVDFISMMDGGKARHVRTIPVTVWTGDQKHDLEDYLVRRKDKVFANLKARQATAVMRAILKAEPVRIKASGYFDETLSLPPLDEQVAQFISVCDKAGELADLIKESRADD